MAILRESIIEYYRWHAGPHHKSGDFPCILSSQVDVDSIDLDLIERSLDIVTADVVIVEYNPQAAPAEEQSGEVSVGSASPSWRPRPETLCTN